MKVMKLYDMVSLLKTHIEKKGETKLVSPSTPPTGACGWCPQCWALLRCRKYDESDVKTFFV